jgi:hypothetical protein
MSTRVLEINEAQRNQLAQLNMEIVEANRRYSLGCESAAIAQGVSVARARNAKLVEGGLEITFADADVPAVPVAPPQEPSHDSDPPRDE